MDSDKKSSCVLHVTDFLNSYLQCLTNYAFKWSQQKENGHMDV